MKRALLSLSLLLAIPFCALSELKQDNAPPAITVYTQFEHPYSAVASEHMRQELVNVMGPLGLEFTWRDLNASRGNEVSVELVVVTFKGTCNMADTFGYGETTGAL